MITTTARVVSIADGHAQVESTASSSCSGCQTRSSCGVSGLGKYFTAQQKVIEVQCDAGVHAGDELQMAMSETDFLKAGLLAYLLPSLFTIVGAGAASTYGDVGSVAGAASGFAIGLLSVRLLKWVPHMTVSRNYGLFNEGDTP